ncbi:MAG: chitobiase/beta-hexosaminidase C-terminal domain-containing protein, partial [Verrucomicrobiota bacterium]
MKDTRFNPDRGFYTNSVTVSITSNTDNVTIRYTLDGSWPTETTGLIYGGPLTFTNTTVLRAAAYRPGWQPSDVDSHTYLFLDDIINRTNPPAGYPSNWVTRGGTSRAADYTMDPDIINSPVYAPQMEPSLLHHPTVAMSIDIDEMFGQTNGIYANPGETATNWERHVSAEFINFPGEDSFQLNCAVRVYGNASRSLNRPKHNMRLVFKSQYGPGTLDFPAFRDGTIHEYNGYQMRGQNGDSWIHPTTGQQIDATMLRDQVPKDLQVAMGMPSPQQDHMHLYVNGIYWGFYHTIERIDDNFMAKHFGGEQTDYDVLKAVNQTGVVGVRDGDTVG